MPNNEYHFITHWRLRATINEVVAVLADATDLPRWWPSVYLEALELEPGDGRGVGKVISLYTKGWLPYTLRWQFRVTELSRAHLTLEAWGDFVGRGIWSFVEEGDWVIVTYDWKIRADKPLLRYLSPLLKPIFSANHHWAMARGKESLELELQRRRTTTPEERARLPLPPQPTSYEPPIIALALMAGLGLGYWLLRDRSKVVGS